MTQTSTFARLAGLNVNDHIEKKNGFSYLSWPYAVAQLRKADPTASWLVQRFDGLPYLKTEVGYFVEVSVCVDGLTLSQIHPVLYHRNRTIEAPTAFDINTSIQRALVKAIALHGLGLYVYAGEDLPEGAEDTPPSSPMPTVIGNSPRASAAQLRYITRLIEETGSDLGRVLTFFQVDSLESLTPAMASRVIQSLEKSRRAA